MSIRRPAVLLASGIAVTSLLLITAASALFCEASLRVQRRPFTPSPMPVQDIRITTPDGIALDAWLVKPPARSTHKCVIMLHGISDSRQGVVGFAPMLLAQGYALLLPDSRAHGRSGGAMVTYGLLEKHDIIRWVHWLQTAGCTDVYGLGESLGASILIQASAVEPVFRAIVAESPYADLRTIAEYRVRERLHWPDWLATPAAHLVVAGGIAYARLRYNVDLRYVSPANAIAQSSTPILLIHGMKDTNTPPSHSQRLAQANPRNVLWLLPNAAHTNASSTSPREFQARVLAWFGSHRS